MNILQKRKNTPLRSLELETVQNMVDVVIKKKSRYKSTLDEEKLKGKMFHQSHFKGNRISGLSTTFTSFETVLKT